MAGAAEAVGRLLHADRVLRDDPDRGGANS